MTRKLFALALLFPTAPAGVAQDMPLSQILLDGEGWKKVQGNPANPTDGLLLRIGTDKGKNRMTATVGGRELVIAEGGASPDGPHAIVLSGDGGTAFLGYPGRRAVWAFRVAKDGKLSAGGPYCPLRVPAGWPALEVRALAQDADGRIYAATAAGVHVFDPTGRLCGVLNPAAKGTPDHLAFEGDQLVCWIDSTKYTRKLNTTGVK